MIANLISIIIPCYNQGHFLEETLKSVYSQTYTDWECIIINDGSLDDTENVAKKWCEKNSKFKYFKKENGGLSSARNAGLKVAQGEYIQFLDADDLLHEDKFSQSILMFKNENYEIILTNFLRFKKIKEKTKRAFCNLEQQEFNFKSILLDWDRKFTIPIHCGLFKRELIGGIQFEESIKAKEDWVFWLELFIDNPKVGFIDEALTFYRVNPKGMTRDATFMELNKSQALVVIFNRLDDVHKQLFFKRVSEELIESRLKFRHFKYNVFYRKLFYQIKGLFPK